MLPSLQTLNWQGFLARPQLPAPPPEALRALAQQPILITGAGGSIGSALALRLGALAPPKLVLLEDSESNLYALERDWAAAGLAGSCAASLVAPILGNVADEALLKEIFSTHAPRIVFHSAAFKQVPLMEEQPLAAIQNNIFSTETLARTAAAYGARVLLLSTDKAVAPSSVMGATKRVAEQIVLSSGGAALRLGNVLASRDSVAEVFARQIARGGPVTVTNREARRYFLSLGEAASLLLTAAALAQPSALLAPVLPAPHLILDLARFMISELALGREIAVAFTGNRSGDKQSEQLWSGDEWARPAGPEALVSIQSSMPAAGQLASSLASLRADLEARDLEGALGDLRALVPGYTPSPAVLELARRCGSQVCL